jgi:hypothetical protein
MNIMKSFSMLLLTFLLSTGAIFGQNMTGRIVGTIVFPDGTLVPGSTIVATNVQTRKERTVTTTDDGTFDIPQLELINNFQMEVLYEATCF